MSCKRFKKDSPRLLSSEELAGTFLSVDFVWNGLKDKQKQKYPSGKFRNLDSTDWPCLTLIVGAGKSGIPTCKKNALNPTS